MEGRTIEFLQRGFERIGQDIIQNWMQQKPLYVRNLLHGLQRSF